MAYVTYAEAFGRAILDVMDADPRVVLIGGGFAALRNLDAARQKYAHRLRAAPSSELAFTGLATGAAMAGLRPIVHLGIASFAFEAIPQIVNEAAIACFNSAGQVRVPIVFHMSIGIRGGGGVQHSATTQAWYWNTPGLQVMLPSSPADVYGMFKYAALRSENPTVFLDHHGLAELRGELPDDAAEIPLGQAEVKRHGTDVTIVATSVQVPRALEAADVVAREHGISVEVVDPRSLQPLDRDTILRSVRKTGRAITTDESPDNAGVAAALAAIIADEAFASLRAPVKRVAIPNVPIPYARSLEQHITPTADKIAAAIREVVPVRP